MAKVGHTICHKIRTFKRKITDNEDLCLLLPVFFLASYNCKPCTKDVR